MLTRLTCCSSPEHSHLHIGVTVSTVCMPTLDTTMFVLGRIEKHCDILHYEGSDTLQWQSLLVMHSELP